jgi:lysozyme
MKKKAVIALAALALIGGVWWSSRRYTQGAGTNADGSPAAADYDPGAASFIEQINAWTVQNVIESDYLSMTQKDLPQADANTRAFLEMIKRAEGTTARGDPYRVCYAYRHTVQNMADHPAITGEWRGEPLSATMCAGAGLSSGCVSTAAGAYQFIKPTWVGLKKKLGLTDFSAASQDAGAIELLRQRGALAYVEQGRFSEAINAARKEWASLAGAGYGQGERSLSWLEARFTENGGVLA